MNGGKNQEETMHTQLTPEEESKDAFFQELARISEEMVARHGKEFSMGALVLAEASPRPARRGARARRPQAGGLRRMIRSARSS